MDDSMTLKSKYPHLAKMIEAGCAYGTYCLFCLHRYSDGEVAAEDCNTSVCPCGNSYVGGISSLTGNRGYKDVVFYFPDSGAVC